MDVNNLAIFVEAMRKRNFVAVAKERGVNPASISRDCVARKRIKAPFDVAEAAIEKPTKFQLSLTRQKLCFFVKRALKHKAKFRHR